MPKVNLGRKDYGAIFKGELQAARTRRFMDRSAIAEKTDCSYGTVRNYELEPAKIPVGWLKRFIKVTNMDPNVILNYLYEGKYHVRVDTD